MQEYPGNQYYIVFLSPSSLFWDKSPSNLLPEIMYLKIERNLKEIQQICWKI